MESHPGGLGVKTPMPSSALESNDLTFGIRRLGILDENGDYDSEHEPKLSVEELDRLYRAMVLAREVDDRLLKLQRQGRIGTFPPCTGQEASTCAPTLAMAEKDWFVGSFREMGGRLMRGEPIENAFIYYNGYEEGNTFPGGDRTLPISVIIASQMLHAVGIGYAMKLRGDSDSAVVCFMGDGATSEGDFHEALNFASVWQVPVVFICQNNHWAISVPRRRQTGSRTLAQKAIAYDIAGVQVDGNDPLAMYQATKEALDRAHAGKGATLIEAVTYRMRMHTTADDPNKYRSEDEVQRWEKRDPLTRFRTYLERKGIWGDEQQRQLEAEVKQRIEEAVKAFESRTDFKPDAPFDHVFGTRHAVIEQQRAEFLDNLKRETSDA
jgi:pyruvate dehydrogenase E1 component alpha subunit